MPIDKNGWELHVVRSREDKRGSRRRTVGAYRVFHDGKAVAGLSGALAETRGPGDNSQEDNGRRVEAGRYPLWTQDGSKYVTIGYSTSQNSNGTPKPGVELKGTGKRTEILLHPGRGFLSSIGCLNPCSDLADEDADIDYVDSRQRTIAIIEDLKAYLGKDFPKTNGKRIAKAVVVIDGEP